MRGFITKIAVRNKTIIQSQISKAPREQNLQLLDSMTMLSSYRFRFVRRWMRQRFKFDVIFSLKKTAITRLTLVPRRKTYCQSFVNIKQGIQY